MVYIQQKSQWSPDALEEEVDLRLVVIAYDRTASAMKCLESLQDLELDGDRAVIDVFLDRGKDGQIHGPTLQAVSAFRWKRGPVKIHQQLEHVGIIGQWIDSWRPRVGSREIAIILEDDIDLSKHAYRWLKAANQAYGHLPYVGGFSLFAGSIPGMPNLPDDNIFIHPILGTYGFAPVAKHWHDFRLWYHEKSKDPLFRPYVEASSITTGWYRQFEREGRESSMWEQWYIRFTYDYDLFTAYSNLAKYSEANKLGLSIINKYLAYHRQEKGLHYDGPGARSSSGHLIEDWDDKFVDFQQQIKRFFYDGNLYEGKLKGDKIR